MKSKGLRLAGAFLIFSGVILFYCSLGSAETHEYIGAQKCKMCHQKPEQGEQYRIWQESNESKAYETLATPEAKETAAKMGTNNRPTSG